MFTPTFSIVRQGSKGSTSAIVTIGSPEPDLDWVKPKASALIVFNDGRHTTELMSTKNLVHKSHNNNEHRRKVSVGVLFSSKMLLTLHGNIA